MLRAKSHAARPRRARARRVEAGVSARAVQEGKLDDIADGSFTRLPVSRRFRLVFEAVVYALAQLTIRDRERYERYVARFAAVLARYDGKLLVADEAPEVVEGVWNHDKVILLSFASEDSYAAFADSEEYRAIAVDRRAATEGPVLLLHGIRR